MKILRESINHYLHWMQAGWHFALAGYSDAEWYCILGEREGERTGLGQTYSAKHGEKLLDILQRRQGDERFLFAIPEVLLTLPGMAEGEVDWLLGRNNIRIVGYERDRITDDLARDAKLGSLIAQLRTMHVIMVGPEALHPHVKFLKPRKFVGIPSPNLHMDEAALEDAIARTITAMPERDAILLVSAGVSAAVIIDRVYDVKPDNWYFDCGSIWDAFAGIGGQREWRAKLYENPKDWERWKRRNAGKEIE